ncbi:MAG: hypothetical protein GX846_09430, partial [Deltaproteobacteria bacterium]|nr:hypothetical protein [Deltaproteobacteria bacterium]
MEEYKQRLARLLAQTGALFFDNDLVLKDTRPTPYFINFGMFRTGSLIRELGSLFSDMIVAANMVSKTDIILGPSYKGSAIALATAIGLYEKYGHDLFFEYDRKEVKKHGEGSTSASLLVNRTMFDGCRIFIVDDVTTTMGTKYELIESLNNEAASQGVRINVSGIGIAVDREQSTAVYDDKGKYIPDAKGENTIKEFTLKTGIPVYAVGGIKEIINYLYEEGVPVMIQGKQMPIDNST